MLTLIADKPSMSWVKSFNLLSLQQGVARLAPQPGHRELVKFLTQPRRDQLAQLMQGVVGSTVRIEVEAAAPGAQVDESAMEGPRSGGGGGRASALEQAMSLPLVKQVMELFDAQIVDVRPEAQAEEAAAAAETLPAAEAPSPPRPAAGPPMRPVESNDDEDEEE